MPQDGARSKQPACPIHDDRPVERREGSKHVGIQVCDRAPFEQMKQVSARRARAMVNAALWAVEPVGWCNELRHRCLSVAGYDKKGAFPRIRKVERRLTYPHRECIVANRLRP